MKKIRSLILILLLPLCFSECTESQSEDQLLQNNEELTVNEAKEFISSQCIDQFSLKSGSLEDKAIKIKADWGRVKSSSNNKVSLVEADILTLGGKFSFATKQNFEAYQKTKQIDFVSSPTRLIVKKNKKTHETVAFFMTIVGDQNYLLENACEISNNSYLNIDKKFNGVVLFHNLQGDFVNGWKYSNGKISHTVSMNQNLNIDTKLKSTANCICETTSYFYTTWEDRYQTVHSEGIEPVTSYSHSRAITIEIVVENCTYSGPSGDGVDYSDSPASDPYNYIPVTESAPIVDANDLKNNPKANCIYEKLLNGGILSSLISRYFGITSSSQSYLGELNLTWTLGGSTETLPYGVPRNGVYNSVEIRLNDAAINANSSTNVALSMLHEALHAKLIAEYYDRAGTTDFRTLYAYYKGYGTGQLDSNQEMEMFYDYSETMARALQSFDQSQGVNKSLDFYVEAVKYDLGQEVGSAYKSGEDEFLILSQSTKNCN